MPRRRRKLRGGIEDALLGNCYQTLGWSNTNGRLEYLRSGRVGWQHGVCGQRIMEWSENVLANAEPPCPHNLVFIDFTPKVSPIQFLPTL
jgi:hypothetical protein